MNHLIIAKFKPEYTKEQKLAMYPQIKKIFDNAKSINGVHGVEYHENCTDRSNRYDIMINIIIDEEALALWDSCEWHKQWKAEYGDKLESKCIFDYK